MKYLKFIIENYKAITEPIEVNVEKNSLMPIIGINECGKTTILHAIFSFDFHNDKMFGGIHLRDISNLYSTTEKTATVSALIEMDFLDFKNALQWVKSRESGEVMDFAIEGYLESETNWNPIVKISRSLRNKKYTINIDGCTNQKLNSLLVKEIINKLPRIIYFDDFRDSISEEVEIKRDEDGEAVGWLGIIETLFKKTDPNFSVFKLGDLEARMRKSTIAKVERSLNDTLTAEWQNFNLDDKDVLTIKLDYRPEGSSGSYDYKEFITIEVIETDADNQDHYFYIRDRSKGFYWFFNFVMKLEFNPKRYSEQDNTVYLLDEPGSYLHASAQQKLASKLKALSKENTVIYCTHSHYLLDPQTIPISTVKIAQKDRNGKISLSPIYDISGRRRDNLAFQPIIDALQVKPFILDINVKRALLVEGIHDYYAFEIFKTSTEIAILPCTGATSIKSFISLMVFWGVDYIALWDNDDEGRKAKEKAAKFFGERISKDRFRLLPLKGKNRILQDCIDGSDMEYLKTSLDLNQNAKFKSVITELYYSSDKEKIVKGISLKTKENFKEIFDLVS